MNRQRKVLITITYNEMGIIIDTKAEEVAQPQRAKGEWLDREQCQVDEDAYDVAICSNCKAEITLEYPNDNYCPNCGSYNGGDKE